MDIQGVVQQLVGAVAKNPELLTRMLEHPYSTIGNVTKNDNVSKEEASQVVTAMSMLAGGNQVDFGSLAGIASQFLGQNNNSVHSLAASLLGSGSSQGVDLTSGLTKSIMGGFSKGIDLSDGIDAKDAIGLISMFLK